MPHHWLAPAPDDIAPQLEIWAHQSLAPRGLVWMVGLTAALLAVPLLPTLTTPAFWALLPFPLVALWGLWAALGRSGRDRRIREILTFGPDCVTLEQFGPKGHKSWSDNPYWVEVRHHPAGGPVEDYITLRGPAGREVEVGAFLSPEERLDLLAILRRRLPQRP